MKKALHIFLCLAILTSFLVLPAHALTEGDWEFQLENGEAHITGYIGPGGDVVIPATLRGVPVTQLNAYCCDNIECRTITIPGSVKVIKTGAFWYNHAEEITIEEGVESIEKEAFSYSETLKKINIPVSACNNLGEYLLHSDPALTDVTLPEGMKAIPKNMFQSCDSLTQITIPSTVEKIGEFAFSSTGLTSVNIPANVVELESFVFDNCYSLKSVTFSGTALTTIGSRAFYQCYALEDIIFPVSLKHIGNESFVRDAMLKGVLFPYGMTYIGHSTFQECTNMEWASVPSTVTEFFVRDFVGDKCPNLIVYCPAGSKAAENCNREEISYLTDDSADSPLQVLYNRDRISFGAYGQNPVIINDRTMVPLRSIFEAMGASVEWDAATRSATSVRNGVTIVVTIDSSTMLVNGEAKTLDSPAVIVNDRTMVPVRAIAEAFNAQVGWNAPGHVATITE